MEVNLQYVVYIKFYWVFWLSPSSLDGKTSVQKWTESITALLWSLLERENLLNFVPGVRNLKNSILTCGDLFILSYVYTQTWNWLSHLIEDCKPELIAYWKIKNDKCTFEEDSSRVHCLIYVSLRWTTFGFIYFNICYLYIELLIFSCWARPLRICSVSK